MAQTLEHNKAVTTVVPVSIPTFDDDLAIIQKLDDEPNDVGGLTAMELKAKFDEGNVTAQQYINNVLIPAVVADGLTEQARQSAEAERVANEIERVGNEEARVSAEEERERAIAKVENMTATATTLPAGSPATAEIVPDPATGAYNVKLGIPAGKDGYGAGDMLASTYDPTSKRQDVFKYSDTKISEHNGNTSAHADIRAALDGKAPAGYGLGGSINQTGADVPQNDSGVRDFNKAVNTGWYWIYGVGNDYVNGPPGENSVAISFMRVECSRYAVQTVYSCYNTSNPTAMPTIWMRKSGDRDYNAWGDWECVNPPMEIGVEYRTTERFMGQPVYVCAIDFGSLPNASQKRVDHNCPVTGYLISSRAFTRYSDSDNSCITLDNYEHVSACYATRDKFTITTTTDMSGWGKVYAILKYTKTIG